MNPLRQRFEASPLLARVGPFVLFVGLTFCQGKFGESSPYWFYFVKTLVGAWLIWLMRPFVAEMKWNFSWEAVVVGVSVFGLWVGLDGFYPTTDHLLSRAGLARPKSESELASELWNPLARFGQASALAWLFIAARVFGATLVVPPLEEVFYRSFFYRYVAKADFQSVPLGEFRWMPFVVTSLVFGAAHREWLAGMLCGFAYQGLVCRKQRLGDAVTAHAITNFLLGMWVVSRGAWRFW